MYAKSRSRSGPSGTALARALNRSVPSGAATSSSTVGLTCTLWYQLGFIGAPHGLRRLLEGVAPVDARGHVAGLDEVGQPLEVSGARLRRERGQPLTHERRQKECAHLAAHAGQPAARFAADDDERALWREGAPKPRKCRVPADIEDQVVPMDSLGEVLPRVVDDVVG